MSEVDTDIKNLLDDLRSNPDAVNDYSEEELKKLQNKIFEHGVIRLPKEEYAAISIVNWRDNYLMKLHLTSLISYVYRLIKEINEETFNTNMLANSVDSIVNSTWKAAEQFQNESMMSRGEDIADAERNANLRTQFMKESASAVKKVVENAVKEQIEVFFRRHFEYDPDRHVESAFKENTADPERVGRYAEMKAKMSTSPPECTVERSTECTVELSTECSSEATNSKIKQLYQDLTAAERELSTVISSLDKYKKSQQARENAVNSTAAAAVFLSETVKTLANVVGKGTDILSDDVKIAIDLVNVNCDVIGNATADSFGTDDLSGILSKHRSSIEEEARKLYFLDPVLLEDVKGAYEWIPSTNVFYHWQRYLSNHYEQLREATAILYNEKPDIEFQLQYYGSFDTVEAAREFERKYESNVITSVYTVQNGGWTILGPFKENRGRIDFYNKNTEIIKRMLEQAESDQALGKDLMQKRIRRAKKQNILDAGPDDPGLAKYKAAVSTVEALGAKEGLSREEKDQLAQAYRDKEMAEVPDDAIQVDVFGPDGKGGLQKSHFYTQAEAPEFMEQNIADQHDRMRAISQGGVPQNGNRSIKQSDDDSGSLRVKTVTSRDGKVRTLADLKRSLPPNIQ